MLGIEPTVQSGPNERELRALRRTRGFVSEQDRKSIKTEHRFIFSKAAGTDQPFPRTIVVVTDDDATVQFILESK
jgi:hypothetical protein